MDLKLITKYSPPNKNIADFFKNLMVAPGCFLLLNETQPLHQKKHETCLCKGLKDQWPAMSSQSFRGSDAALPPFLRSPKLSIGTEGFQGTFFWGGWRVVYFWFQIAKKHRCKVWKNSSVDSAAKPAQQFTELVGYSIKHGVPAHLRWWSPNSFSSTVLPLILKRKKKQGEEGEATNNPVSNDPFFASFSSIHHPSIQPTNNPEGSQTWRATIDRTAGGRVWRICAQQVRIVGKKNARRAPIMDPCHLFPSRVSLFLVSFEHSDFTWSYFGWCSLACWYDKPEIESRLQKSAALLNY